jgi:N-ethylmaleimide reductase
MKLFEQVTIGNNTLKNRMAMAAMTRSRAGLEGIVTDLTVEYYTQRATAGLILTEAINISKQALGSPFTPGLFNEAQIAAWQKVTKAVHEKGSVIYAQLWHTGRVGHSVDRGGALPVAPSAIAITGQPHYTSQGPKEYETPQALTIEQIKDIIADYVQAAKNAIAAGFDGVELHAANGYLPHQFLAENANNRTDKYGGSIENNSRFTLEVMQALIAAVGGDKVGIKISPLQPYGGIVMANPVATFTYLIEELNKLDFTFVELMKKSGMMPLLPGHPEGDEVDIFGKMIKHSLIVNGGYGRDSGEAELLKGTANMISYGSTYLANPDLPKRFELNADLNQGDPSSWFGGTEKGYTDYPLLA